MRPSECGWTGRTAFKRLGRRTKGSFSNRLLTLMMLDLPLEKDVPTDTPYFHIKFTLIKKYVLKYLYSYYFETT